MNPCADFSRRRTFIPMSCAARCCQSRSDRTPSIPRSSRNFPEVYTAIRTILPLMSLVLEQFYLRGYNLAISNEFRPAKGVIARADTMHICYCHSPMRYLWDFYQDYLESTAPLTRLLMRSLFRRLRLCSFLLPSGLTTSSPISIRYSSGLDGGGGKK